MIRSYLRDKINLLIKSSPASRDSKLRLGRIVVSDDRPNVLALSPMPDALVDRLEQSFNLLRLWRIEQADDFFASHGSAVQALVTGNGQIVDATLLDRLPSLELVSVFGAGYEKIDALECAARGIVVTNTSRALADEVADTAVGLLLMTVRKLSSAERWLRAGKWTSRRRFPLSAGTMRNRRMGIVGLGSVGTAIARRLEGFDVAICYHGRHEQPDVHYPYYSTLADMARDVDTLVVCTPGGAATRNIIDSEVLRALGENGVLINVSRGTCVDEDTLIRALESRQILGAGLDVYQSEPNVSRRLLKLSNAVLLPHVGSASQYTRGAMGELTAQNVESWFRDGSALTPVAECRAIAALVRRPSQGE